jgi:hypothetical protein
MPACWRERRAPPLDGRCMGGEGCAEATVFRRHATYS